MENTNQKRQTATITNIQTINQGTYKKEEGWDPNYIITKSGHKLFRVNLIATVISVKLNESNQVMVIDDGVDQIEVRNFDENINLENFKPQDIVLIIGKPREYGTIYIAPEIIKIIQNPLWIKVRSLQLKQEENYPAVKKQFEVEKEQVSKPSVDFSKINNEELLDIIREMDSGDGVDIDELLQKVQNETLISEMIRQGDIFEIRPGRIKILE